MSAGIDQIWTVVRSVQGWLDDAKVQASWRTAVPALDVDLPDVRHRPGVLENAVLTATQRARHGMGGVTFDHRGRGDPQGPVDRSSGEQLGEALASLDVHTDLA